MASETILAQCLCTTKELSVVIIPYTIASYMRSGSSPARASYFNASSLGHGNSSYVVARRIGLVTASSVHKITNSNLRIKSDKHLASVYVSHMKFMW